MLNTAIALPYELARLPLVVVDNQLAGKLPETSRPRVVLDRAIGSADKIAGTLLRNSDIAQRGADRIERSDKLVQAARLEQEAVTRREQARETATSGQQEAERKRRAAQSKVTSGLEEADVAEAKGKQQATAKAAKTAATKKATAERRAASKRASVEQEKQRVEAAAEAEKKAVQEQAKAELEDVRETKQQAAEARADADRLDELVESKKQERQRD